MGRGSPERRRRRSSSNERDRSSSSEYRSRSRSRSKGRRKGEQGNRLMAMAHKEMSKDDLKKMRDEWKENVYEHKDVGGSARDREGRGRRGGGGGGEEYMDHRRTEREMISFNGCQKVWGRSPDRGFDSDIDSEPEAMEVDTKEKKKKKKSKKSKKKKSKKSKKKKKKSSSSESSDSEDEDCWVEKDVMLSVAERRAKEVSFQDILKIVKEYFKTVCHAPLFQDESEEEQMIGPQLPQKVKCQSHVKRF